MNIVNKYNCKYLFKITKYKLNSKRLKIKTSVKYEKNKIITS